MIEQGQPSLRSLSFANRCVKMCCASSWDSPVLYLVLLLCMFTIMLLAAVGVFLR